jgi:hypothetical protein
MGTLRRLQIQASAYFASEADEKELLKRQAKLLENQLDDVKKRLEELED